MHLSGLHILLTYQCTFECDHCFVWGSPWQTGVFTLAGIEQVLDQAHELGLSSIYFEGGEPFLYYPILVEGARMAAQRGFSVGLVTNAYWATTVEDAQAWLAPLADFIDDLTVSSDLYHYSERISRQAKNASRAAEQLGLATGMITIETSAAQAGEAPLGQLPDGDSGVMHRGRAVQKLAPQAIGRAWETFTECPYEDLVDPGRLHLDPLGNLHLCQGIVIGNLFEDPLREIIERYDPRSHPVAGPLLAEGPAGLVRTYQLKHMDMYADACHLCYEARLQLREKFPAILCPDQMYGGYEVT
jgi:MoaA/NifB/PqqE/SkfB family radical SAM enzyme